MDLDSRIALVGPNGAGKSTLLKLMLGKEITLVWNETVSREMNPGFFLGGYVAGELTPTIGAVRRHFHLRLGRYNQHSNEQLDLELTPLKYMQKMFPEEKLEEESWRTSIGRSVIHLSGYSPYLLRSLCRLCRYGISGSQQNTPISQLSDGQKSRIVFAVIAQQTPHILLLDEVRAFRVKLC